MLFVLIASASIPFFVAGIALLILYFAKRKQGIKQSKARFVWPMVSLCIGEVLLAPICALIGLIILNNLAKAMTMCIYVFFGAIFILGLVLIILCAIQAHKKTLKSGLLLTSVIVFLLGFEIFATVAVYVLPLLII